MDETKYYLEEFKKYISLQTSSVNTVKNYLSDLRVFFTFTSQNLSLPVSAQTLPLLLSETTLVKYDEFLSVTNPPATAKRRASSLKKFIEFCASQNIISPLTPPVPSVPFAPTVPSSTPAFIPPYEPPASSVSVSPPSSYSPLPPVSTPPPPSTPPASDFKQPPATITTEPSGPTPWSAVLSPKAFVNDTQNLTFDPPVEIAAPSQPHSPDTVTSPSIVSYLPDFSEDGPSPDHQTSPSHTASKPMSLYLVLSLILIAFLASFSITYLIATTLLSK